jgi:hypothetical protein
MSLNTNKCETTLLVAYLPQKYDDYICRLGDQIDPLYSKVFKRYKALLTHTEMTKKYVSSDEKSVLKLQALNEFPDFNSNKMTPE